ncbi:MAG: peptide deformylase [Ignavibacteriae bacterium]|nr:MAG: peptide deformylase [Ignavibacteriota bacterium]
MSILPIYLFGTEILKKKAKQVESLDDSTVKLIYDMFETMHEANGIGLAATQVGDIRRVITIDIGEDTEPSAEGETEDQLHPTSPGLPRTLALINPEVLSEEGQWTVEEGCLSLPKLHGDVERAEKVKVRYHDTEFKVQEILADGLLARVILHELDHLNGVLFVDRMSKAKRSLLLPKLRKIRKGEIEVDYPVVTVEEE